MTKDRFFKRYSYIINTVKRKRINREQLSSDILKHFDELGHYSTRTLSRDLNDIKSIFGIEIIFNRKHGYYEIYDDEILDEDIEKQKQLEAFQYVEIANMAREYNDILLFEQRKPVGMEYIPLILEAIKNVNIVSFNYLKFTIARTTNRRVKPLALREHNSRWYLVAEELNANTNVRKTFGLDRISNFETSSEHFAYPTDFDVKKHFEHFFGVSEELSTKIETIWLKFDSVSAKYIETLPLHASQKEIERTDYYVVFEYKLYINQELIREIIKIGSGVTVLKPRTLKNDVIKKLKEILNLYA